MVQWQSSGKTCLQGPDRSHLQFLQLLSVMFCVRLKRPVAGSKPRQLESHIWVTVIRSRHSYAYNRNAVGVRQPAHVHVSGKLYERNHNLWMKQRGWSSLIGLILVCRPRRAAETQVAGKSHSLWTSQLSPVFHPKC